MKRKFDDIVGFAGLEQFIDTPVKRYSSGMYVRLAFSVAAFLEPEILIIDEVLSVGDHSFKSNACSEWSKSSKTAEPSSSSPTGQALVQQVCRRAIFLQKGKIMFDGAIDDALAAYEKSLQQEAAIVKRASDGQPDRLIRRDAQTCSHSTGRRCCELRPFASWIPGCPVESFWSRNGQRRSSSLSSQALANTCNRVRFSPVARVTRCSGR